ncbi:MAG: transglutaminase family protein [Chromatiaceae bacterium]
MSQIDPMPDISGARPAGPDPGTLELEVLHETCYEYDTPVSFAHHLAYLRPLTDAYQVLINYALEVEPAPAQRRDGTDVFGNACNHLTILQPHRELRVRAHARLRVSPRFTSLDPEAAPNWKRVRDRLLYVARAPFDPAVEFVQPSPYVPRLEALREYALPSFPSGRPVAAAALDLMHRIHADFRYEARSTEIDTPLEEAFTQRRGVCQDFAHLMVGSLRMLRLPARYVSGYLRTSSGDGPLFVGADASHAWVQVYAPGTPGVPADGWLDLDPTNDLVPASGHVRLAVGRDFGDVAPLSGVIRGGGHHRLTVGVTTRLLGPA